MSGRYRFVRASVSSGFRAPTPGQQNAFNISSWFDPTIGDLINNAVIPSLSPVARLRGGAPLGPERSVNYTAGVVLDTGAFTLTADYFHIDVSDRIGITSNFILSDAEIAGLVAGGFDAAESVRNFRFFTNAFATSSQGIDVVSTFTPLALRGNTVLSAVFNYTDTRVTDNAKGLLDGRRLAEYAHSLPRTRGNIGVTQRMGRARLLGRLSYYGGWYDYDSGLGEVFRPVGRPRAGLLRRPPDPRPGAELRSRARDDAGRRWAERPRYVLAGVHARELGGRAVQRIHPLGLQRRLLLRARRIRLGQLSLRRAKRRVRTRPESTGAGVGRRLRAAARSSPPSWSRCRLGHLADG